MQITQHVLMIRPVSFSFNAQTALSNVFQDAPGDTDPGIIRQKAIEEFDAVANVLQAKGINVIVVPDTSQPAKPDAIFPNNWTSYHHDGTVILYPMFAPNRRLEKRADIIDKLRANYKINNVVDLSGYEFIDRFLEGTGSIVFDHDNRTAYACLSSRTNKELFQVVSDRLNYRPIWFNACDAQGIEIYHTNVMMCIAEKFVIICLDAIYDPQQKEQVLHSLTNTGREVINIPFDQMTNFAGNVLALKNNLEQQLVTMSQTAFDSFTPGQRDTISKYGEIVAISVPTIESTGGGSVRCMMAEIFLPLK